MRDAISRIASRGLLAAAAIVALFACGDPTGSGGGGGAGTPTRIDVVSGDLQTAVVGTELPQPLVVKVLDGRGRPVAGWMVRFRVLASGLPELGTVVTDARGEASQRWRLSTAAGDTQRVEARVLDPSTGLTQVVAAFRAVATADVPAAIDVNPARPATGMAGLPLPDSATAYVTDRWGNPVPSTPVVWTVRAGGGSASPAQSLTDARGVARTSWTLGAQLDTPQVLEGAAGLTVKDQALAVATTLSGGSVSKASGDAQTGAPGAQLAQPLVVVVRSPGGLPVSGARVTWSTSDGTLAPATGVTDSAGRAQARWTLPLAGGTMTASAAVPGAGVATFTAASVGEVAVRLDSLPAGPVIPGSTLTLRVIARDAQGHPAIGATVRWSVLAGGGSVPAQSVTGGDGVATAAWRTGTAGTQQAEARIDAAAPVVFTRPGLAPTPYTFTVDGGGQSSPAGTWLPRRLTLRVRDAAGNPVSNYPTYWVITPTPYDADPVEVRTAYDGTVTREVHLRPDYVGSYDISIWAPGYGAGEVVAAFHLSASGTLGPPDGIVTERDTLRGPVGGGHELLALLYDANGRTGAATSDTSQIIPRLLGHTGAVELVRPGSPMIPAIRWYLSYVQAGTERVEVARKNGAADTLTVVVGPP